MTFITKDSGQRVSFDSGMVRDVDTGKIKWHLVASGPMLQRWAALMTRGAEKYEEDNWMRAEGEAERKRFRASAFRHFMQWFNGDTDEDHGAAVFFNINGAEYVKEKLAARSADIVPFEQERRRRVDNAILDQRPDWERHDYEPNAVLHTPPHKVRADDPHQPGQA